MEMTVTRALAEIKHLNDRISRATNEPFVAMVKGRDKYQTSVGTNKTPSEVSEMLTSNLQSVLDLIKRRSVLKSKVQQSNATTKVVVGGVEMTVAEAIEQKVTIEHKATLATVIQGQYSKLISTREQNNVKLSQEIDNAVQAAYNNEKGKVDVEQYEAVAKPRLDRNEYNLLDPNKVEDVYNKLREEVNAFKSEVDFVLSESNAKTVIEV